MKNFKKTVRIMLSIILSLCMILSVYVCPYATEIETLESESVNIDFFTFQTSVKENKVTLMVSQNNPPENITYEGFYITPDSTDFTTENATVRTGKVVSDADLSPKCRYNQKYGQYIISYEIPENSTEKISGEGELFTAEFTMPDSLVGMYNFNVTIYYSIGKSTTLKTQIPFSVGLDSPSVIKATSITVSPESLDLKVSDKGTFNLTATVFPENATVKSVTWASDNTSIVSIDSSGKLKRYGKAGKATITATARDGSGVVGTCKVNISVGVSRVYFKQSTYFSTIQSEMLSVGSTAELTPIIEPTNATNTNVLWSSSDDKVATVENGKVTAVSPGIATITATTEDGGHTASRTYCVTTEDSTKKAAKVGNKEYETLSAAFEAVSSGGTVVLLKDVDEDAISIAKNCSFDLNGHTLVTDGITVESSVTDGNILNGTILLKNNLSKLQVKGHLESISDCSVTGEINVAQNTDPADNAALYKGIVDLIENCKVTGKIYVYGEVIKILSCDVTGEIAAGGMSGYTSTDNKKIGYYTGKIDGVYDCNVTLPDSMALVSGKANSFAAPVFTQLGEINVYSGTFDGGKGYSAKMNREGIITIYGGKFKGVQNLDTKSNTSGIHNSGSVIIPNGYFLAENPDENGFYEVSAKTEMRTATFVLTPTDASISVYPTEDQSAKLTPLTLDGQAEGNVSFEIEAGKEYTYSVSKDGYESKNGTIRMDQVTTLKIPVELQVSGSGQQVDTTINGGSVITSGGEYTLADNATGTIVILTREPVTIVGKGISKDDEANAKFSDLSIDCSISGVDLTIKDLWINDNVGKGTPEGDTNFGMNVINFTGKDNTLRFEGKNLLETQEYVQGAGIHVGKGDSLTIDGTGTLYIYKYSQGAGIGGNSFEASGSVTFAGGDVFIKGSKTGPLVGGDVLVTDGDVNDPIYITGGNVVLINKAQGAAIGSSKSGKCAGDVYLKGGNLTIISDFIGSAIGYGGNADSDPGNLYVSGGSFKAMRTTNSTIMNGDSSVHFVDDSLVTAAKHNGDGTKDVELLKLDTSNIPSSDGIYNVTTDKGFTYSGGLHNYYYTESKTYTPDNFGYEPGDTDLYLYLPTDTKLLTVNGKEFNVYWDDETSSFEVSTPKLDSDKIDSAINRNPDADTDTDKDNNKDKDDARFIDVSESDWFNDVVNYVADKGLMTGTSENTFSPYSKTTRGMLMTILARKAGIDTTGSDPWYQKGLDWAKENGISDGTNPEGYITRQQLAAMLYRAAGSPEVTGNLDAFTDKAEVSEYAENALIWAVDNGIMNGKGNGILDPANYATRAEMAAMIMRYNEK